MTKCSTNHFPSENSTKKGDSVFDRLILDIDENTNKNLKQKLPDNNIKKSNIVFDEMFSLSGQNAVGFDFKDIVTRNKANKSLTKTKEKFRTQ